MTTWIVRLCLATFILVTASSPLAAYTKTHEQNTSPKQGLYPHHIVFNVGGGKGMNADLGQSTTFPIVNPATDENYFYNSQQNNQTVGLFNAFLGMEWPLYQAFDVQLGLSYYYLEKFSTKGTLSQGADVSSSNQYAYSYDKRSQPLLIESKWFYGYKRLHPYLLIGLGAAFSSARSYDVTFPAFTTFSRKYANNNQVSFSYDVGIGLDYDISSFARLGIGYRFIDLGKVSLGSATIDTTPVNGTLSQSNLYVDGVVAQLTFFMT